MRRYRFMRGARIRKRSLPPPLPVDRLATASSQTGADSRSEAWELVDDGELIPRDTPAGAQPEQAPPGTASLSPMAVPVERDAEQSPAEQESLAPIPQVRRARGWKPLAAGLGALSLVVAVGWGAWQRSRPAPSIEVDADRTHAARPAASVVYVIPITIVGRAPADAGRFVKQTAPAGFSSSTDPDDVVPSEDSEGTDP